MNSKNTLDGKSPVLTGYNIKNICKKFETLSTDNSNLRPTPPLRKLKNKSNSTDNHKPFCSSNSDPLFSSSAMDDAQENYFSKRRLSVRERTKLFESGSDIKSEKLDPARIRSDSFETSLSETRSSSIDQNTKLVVSPPRKPPRSFASAEKSKERKTSRETNGKPERKTSLLKQEKFSLERTPCNLSGERTQNNSTSEHQQEKHKKIQQPVARSSKLRKCKEASKNKLQAMHFLGLPENSRISKKSKVFVDLTPTTVSPPKNYETLKKSHSEEHIYAEPIPKIERKVDQTNVSNGNFDQSVHYMCTPIVQPKAPERKLSQKLNSKDSVRNLIYNSFASLRMVPKEDLSESETATDGQEGYVSMKAIQDRIIYVKSIRQISGSNICLAPKLYEALYIINILDSQPDISYSFPLKVPEAYRFPLLPHICFPDIQHYKCATTYNSETFHFTLSDKEDKLLGYCLRISGWSKTPHPLCVKLPVAICILSQFYAPLFYEKLLSEIEKHLVLPRERCFKYIRSLQKLGIPNAGAKVSIPDHTECSSEDRVVITRPLDCYKVGFELTRTLKMLDVNILVKTVASLLLERRVLFISSSSSDLYHCCQAVSSLLYPFEWPHMFLPVLPTCLAVHCCSEMPYILGVLNNNKHSLLELLSEQELLIVDIDKGVIVKSYNDEDTILPKKILKALITALNLAKNMTDPTEMLRDIMISEAFIHMFVEMIGHHEDHFDDQNGNAIFQKEGLLKNANSYPIYTFLQWFSETQMFDAFISKCAWRIKYAQMAQDTTRTVFEKRTDQYKWEMSQDKEKFSRFIEKTVRTIGGKIIHKLMK